eukprot:9990733-Lingulodinium_polyedra.AAC.1
MQQAGPTAVSVPSATPPVAQMGIGPIVIRRRAINGSSSGSLTSRKIIEGGGVFTDRVSIE